MAVTGAGERIRTEVSGWDGVLSGPHRFGGVEFRLENREIGHVHGDALVDVPLPKRDSRRAGGVGRGQAASRSRRDLAG